LQAAHPVLLGLSKWKVIRARHFRQIITEAQEVVYDLRGRVFPGERSSAAGGPLLRRSTNSPLGPGPPNGTNLNGSNSMYDFWILSGEARLEA
jgi:hypothetical protein